MTTIKVALVGVGNCASSLVQGIYHYRTQCREEATGLMHWDIGGYLPGDLEMVAAFDVDQRKVGRDLCDAIGADPNCTVSFAPDLLPCGTCVSMGRVLDGYDCHMAGWEAQYTFVVADLPEPTKEEVVERLRETGAEVMVNMLPVGSEKATRFYADCALEAGTALVNCIPVFIASDPSEARRFAERNLPLVGDDLKSQLGATIVHRVLADLFKKRGVDLERTYQLNVGGNTDFLNMSNSGRVGSKIESKTEAVRSVAGRHLSDRDIRIGPAYYIPWLRDQKVCFLRMEGRVFGGVPMNLELRLSVEDSPNAAGVAIDAIRCAKLALDRGEGGPIEGPSAFLMKHPPLQLTDDEANRRTEAFIRG